VRKIVHLRCKHRLGPVAIAARGRVGAPPPCTASWPPAGINRLWHVDRVTGAPIRRYEMTRPGELVHVDVKKLGNVPDGGGWRAHGRAQGELHRHAHRDASGPRKVGGRPNIGYCYVHSAVDAYTRLAYSEALNDEKATTALAFWTRARAFFAGHGITVERVLTDNGSPYISRAWRDEHHQLGIKQSRTRPRRPQLGRV
jgi:transposase InsO family protein